MFAYSGMGQTHFTGVVLRQNYMLEGINEVCDVDSGCSCFGLAPKFALWIKASLACTALPSPKSECPRDAETGTSPLAATIPTLIPESTSAADFSLLKEPSSRSCPKLWFPNRAPWSCRDVAAGITGAVFWARVSLPLFLAAGTSWLCLPSYVVITAFTSVEALSTCFRTMHPTFVHL